MNNTNKSENALIYVGKILLLAVIYYGTARLGLLLAIPPGYATAIWPPSGFALAGILLLGIRYWPGILLGSFASNLFTSFDPSNTSSMIMSASIAGIIAFGAALQSILSAKLVAKFVDLPNPLEHFREIGYLLLLGGPVGCLINASIGVTTLASFHAIPTNRLLYTWLTWWVGDSIGVLIFTPLLLLLFSPHERASYTRKIIVSAALSIVFSLTVVLFFAASKWEHDKQYGEFQNSAEKAVTSLQIQVAQYLYVMHDMAAFYNASNDITRQNFSSYAQEVMQHYPGSLSFSLIQRVKNSERTEFELNQTISHAAELFFIKERDSAGKFIPAREREEYLPVTYIEPYSADIIGYDNASDPQRKLALDEARDNAQLSSTGRITLLQNDSDSYGILIFSPLYKKYTSNQTVQERRDNLIGYIAGAFLIRELLETSLNWITKEDLNFVLYDDSATPDKRFLYDSRSPHRDTEAEQKSFDDFVWEKQINVAGKSWTIKCLRSQTAIAAQQNWTVWVVLTGGLLFTALFGVFILIVTARTDIVQRLVYDKTSLLLQSEQRLRLMTANIQDHAIYLLDENGNVASWNEGAQTLLGYSDEEILGHSMQRFSVNNEIHTTNAAHLLRQAEKNGRSEVESWCLRKDDSRFFANIIITAIRDDLNKLIGFANITRDITEQKNQQELMENSLQRLKQMQSRIDLATDAGRVGIWEWKITTNELVWDAHMYQLFGVDPNQNKLNYSHWSARVHPEDLAPSEKKLFHAKEGGPDFNDQFRIRLPDGTIRYIRAASKLQRDANGKAISIVGVNWDVTELVQARLDAEQAVRTKAEFLANMSHELRTPMNGILGLTALTLKTELTPKQREYLQLVQDSGLSLLTLLNDILDFSKMEAGKLTLSPIDFNLHERLNNIVLTFSAAAKEKGLELSCELDQNVPQIIYADPDRISQIINNLVGNALKFTNKGSVKISVSAETPIKNQQTILFSVEDTGIGIPKSAQEHIFDTFTQADNSTTRRFGGTGLGLSICSQLVELMHGRIWLKSQEGSGSSFYFSITIKRSLTEPATLNLVQPTNTVDKTLLPLVKPLAILLAEDNPTNQLLATAILRDRGHHVTTVQNGREAVQLYNDEKFDLILMDVQMPEMDGEEAASIIRQIEQGSNKHIFIVALTAHALVGDKERLLKAGMDAYLSKPFMPEQLLAMVENRTALADITPNLTNINDTQTSFDQAVALERAMNQMPLLKTLAETFIKSIPKVREDLFRALEARDAIAFARVAHRLKGAAANFAATPTLKIADELENLGQVGSFSQIRALLPKLFAELDRLSNALQAIN